VLLVCVACVAADKPNTGPSKNDLKLAQKSFNHALELQKQGHAEEALQELVEAANLSPANMEYVTAREFMRAQIASGYIDKGNLLAEVGNNEGAAGQFRAALSFDPQNGYAQQRLRDVAPVDEDPEKQHVLQLLASVDEVEVNPKPGKQNFHVHGDSRALYDAIGKAFGIIMSYDQGVATLPGHPTGRQSQQNLLGPGIGQDGHHRRRDPGDASHL
jgi:tetratricopeptide (TPR) repeat protein